ncbi:MAG: hypothetical protein HFP81_03560 [Methylococcales symbiont of Hymedesmia sp. n. MRB-2018]|nr:MAG: hypothetical protein HFP78_05860 [Methylococcales symbiont of Hymedesmia sp. n. MRB-2018]KAF3984201.1 MAG: hypothetical protein HFP81_03560 [Methylococcales symbiont of Hymedesmia sp. n. MRB-2018]
MDKKTHKTGVICCEPPKTDACITGRGSIPLKDSNKVSPLIAENGNRQ